MMDGPNKYLDKGDEELFALFQKGDAAAFDWLLEKYQGALYTYILRFVPDRAQAEDVLQDVFMKVFQRKHQFQKSVSLKAWFYTLCRNACIDSFRKKKRADKAHSKEAQLDGGVPIASQDGANPHRLAQEREIEGFLSQALAQLPEEQRETFSLKVMEDLTFEEVADVMRCSANTAKSRMRYALDVLRGLFMKRGYLR